MEDLLGLTEKVRSNISNLRQSLRFVYADKQQVSVSKFILSIPLLLTEELLILCKDSFSHVFSFFYLAGNKITNRKRYSRLLAIEAIMIQKAL